MEELSEPARRLGLAAEGGGRLAAPGRWCVSSAANWLRAVALQGAHLGLDPAERVAQRSQGRCRLRVVGEARLEVDHALAQQVSLGGQAGGPHRTRLADDRGSGSGADHEAGEEG